MLKASIPRKAKSTTFFTREKLPEDPNIGSNREELKLLALLTLEGNKVTKAITVSASNA
jgi:hypothetical protein